jgi:transposase
MAGAADGQIADHPAAQDRVGHGRPVVEQVVAGRLDRHRLGRLVAIGVDGISYRGRQQYVTTVVDHQTGAIVWAAPGATPRRCKRSSISSPTASTRSPRYRSTCPAGYQQAINPSMRHADICVDPCHVVRLAQRAVDQVRRDEWNAHDRSHTRAMKWIKGTRWTLSGPEKQTIDSVAKLGEVQQTNRSLYRAFLLKEELWLLYHLDDPSLASQLGLDNGRLEGVNSRIRLISHRPRSDSTAHGR